jgi:AraC-like DNA-binding protein
MASKTGRTPAVIDWDTVGKLLEADCKTVDIARQLGISEDTLTRRCKRDLNLPFAVFSQQKKMLGDNLLRAKQYQTAMSGNVVMQIWLGKQRLGQADKAEVSGPGGTPLFPSKVIIGGDNGA